MSSCDCCFNTDKEKACLNCERNPANPRLTDNYVMYPVCCLLGFKDCVNDPGYLWKCHRDYFNRRYGNIIPSPDATPCSCGNGVGYDWEDK